MAQNMILQGEMDLERIVLVVDNDQILNDLFCGELEQSGFTAIPAYNWRHGFKLMRMIRPDLVLLDNDLPDNDRMNLGEFIARDPLLKDTPIIIMSTHFDVETRIKAFNAGACRYLSKIDQFDEIVKSVQAILMPAEHCCSENQAV